MIGAIVGDIVGSIYERYPIKTTVFPLFGPGCRFTDDTVLTVAVAEVLMDGGDYAEALKRYAANYPNAGYGGAFFQWALSEDSEPYNSFGNGSAMRVSPVGWACDTLEDALAEARRTAEVTHNHPQGVLGAQAVAAAVFLARSGATKPELKAFIERQIGYDVSARLDDIRPSYCFDVTCQGTVPPAIVAFLESGDFESAIRNAVSLGGDSDTLTCITGAIAGAHYGVPEGIAVDALGYLDFGLSEVVMGFQDEYCGGL